MTFFREAGITDQELHINSVGTPASRPAFREALRDYVRPFLSQMSLEGQARFEANPLRMLDTKDENDLRLLADAPHLVDFLDDESRDHFDRLQSYLTAAGIPFVVDHRLVRGFDYYTKTAFEIIGKNLGAQSTLCGGGRYDGLVEECGGQALPGIGFGMGMERCLITLEALGIELPVADPSPDAFIVTLGDEKIVRPLAVKLLADLRQAGLAADMDYKSRKFGPQIKRADDLGARFALILGEDEAAKGILQLRDQATKQQREIPITDAVAELRAANGRP
jgi:histidyl-tRNA synthetase